jgi:hypothetical protein
LEERFNFDFEVKKIDLFSPLKDVKFAIRLVFKLTGGGGSRPGWSERETKWDPGPNERMSYLLQNNLGEEERIRWMARANSTPGVSEASIRAKETAAAAQLPPKPSRVQGWGRTRPACPGWTNRG